MLRTYSRQGQRGTAIYEAVIATPLFLLLIFASIQFMVLAWRNLAVQFVATQVLRSVVTGQCGETAGNPTYCAVNDAARAENIKTFALTRARALGNGYGLGDVTADTNFKICISPIDQSGPACTQSTPTLVMANPGDLMEVRIVHESPIVGGIIRMALGGGVTGFGATATSGTTAPLFGLEGRAIGRVEILRR